MDTYYKNNEIEKVTEKCIKYFKNNPLDKFFDILYVELQQNVISPDIITYIDTYKTYCNNILGKINKKINKISKNILNPQYIKFCKQTISGTDRYPYIDDFISKLSNELLIINKVEDLCKNNINKNTIKGNKIFVLPYHYILYMVLLKLIVILEFLNYFYE